jgi:hypothetical protein
VYDPVSATWTDTGVDASSAYELTKEKMEIAYPGIGGNNPVNEIRYAPPEAGNIFGDGYLKCDGSTVLFSDYPLLRLPQLGVAGFQEFAHADYTWNACEQLFNGGTSFYALLSPPNSGNSSLWEFRYETSGAEPLSGTLINADVGFRAEKVTYVPDNFTYNPYKNELLVFGYVEDGHNIVYRSTDFVNFTKIISTNGLSAVSTVVFDESYYYTGGYQMISGTTYMRLFRSENLTDWEQLNFSQVSVYGTFLQEGRIFVIEENLWFLPSNAAGYYRSEDHGTSWVQVDGTGGISNVDFIGRMKKINGVYILYGGLNNGTGVIYTYSEPNTFTQVYYSPVVGEKVFGAFFDEETQEYVFAQRNGFLVTPDFVTFRHVPQGAGGGDTRSDGASVRLNGRYFLLYDSSYKISTGERLRLPAMDNAFIKAYDANE